MTKAKICGLSTPETLDAAVQGGAALIGLMHFPRSPRHVGLEQAALLARRARGKARVAVVLVDPDDALVREVVRVVSPDLIQLHGKETPSRTAEIGRLAGLPLIKALPVASGADVEAAGAYDEIVEHLLFDAKPAPGADRPGGHGAAFDWGLIKGRRYRRPHFLAGGLDPWNVAEAISASGAPLVDVSSGVERGPGLKDAALIGAFLDAVRRA